MATSSGIVLSESAARKVQQLVSDRQNPELMLRVYIEGGGCSGFQYGFDLAEEAGDDDTIIERDGARMVVDPLSFQYLMGAEVDYKNDLIGARFVVVNPNAVTTCGCGASFGV